MKRKMKASHEFPVWLMIAAQTFGPIREEARLVIPKRPKNTEGPRVSETQVL